MRARNFGGKTVSNKVRLRKPRKTTRSRCFGTREAAARRLILRKADTATGAAAEKCPREKRGAIIPKLRERPYKTRSGASERRCAEGEVCR